MDHKTTLVSLGLAPTHADTLLGLPQLNIPAVIAWLQAHGPFAAKILERLLPLFISDPTTLAIFIQLIEAWLAGQTPPVPAPAQP